jgi:Pvc16 N-terminal domain
MAIHEISAALRRLLAREYAADLSLKSIVGDAPESVITFSNPTDARRDATNRLSLWLYQITENEHVKNAAPTPNGNGTANHLPPMALNLFYLMTPLTTSGENDQQLIAKSMQVLYDNAVVMVRNADNLVAEELRIIFCRIELEQLTRIWEALQEPYRLSICYQVRVAHIDSLRLVPTARVTEAHAGLGQSPFEPAGARP